MIIQNGYSVEMKNKMKRQFMNLSVDVEPIPHLPPHEELSIYHHKKIEKQEKQNNFYMDIINRLKDSKNVIWMVVINHSKSSYNFEVYSDFTNIKTWTHY